jgi:hypothetical protein
MLYKNLLNREQLQLITEKAVDWDKSFVGNLTGGISNAFKFIGKKIDKKFKLNKINGLVMQWGTEYVLAIRANDLNLNVKQSTDTDDDIEDNTQDAQSADKIKITEQNKAEYLKYLTTDLKALQEIKKTIHSISIFVTFPELTKALPDIVDTVTDNKKLLDEEQNIIKLIANVKTIDSKVFISDYDLVSDITDLFINAKAKDSVSLLGLLKLSNTTDIKKFSDIILERLKPFDIVINGYNETIKFINEFKPEVQPTKDSQVAKDGQPIKDSQTQKESYLIKEAATFEIPQTIQELLDKDDLTKYELIPDIKKKTLDKINLLALNTIMYEANYIIEKVKKSNGKGEDTTSDELQRAWDLGVKNINNYFQKVIDIKAIMDSVKDATIDKSTEDRVKSQSAEIDLLPKFGLQLLPPTNAKFIDKEFYAFNLSLTGQLGKASKDMYIIVSPTTEYIEDVNNKNYFWFKVFGQYKLDDKGNTIRVNFFDTENITKNIAMKKHFINKESSYYLVFESLKSSVIKPVCYLYSDGGNIFYDRTSYSNANDILTDIKSSNLLNWIKSGNVFKSKMNGRFIVSKDNDNLKQFPGLQLSDATKEKGHDIAKKNHDILINNLKK